MDSHGSLCFLKGPYSSLRILLGPYVCLLACLHVHFWEPVLRFSACILLSYTQFLLQKRNSEPFLCVTQQNSGTRTKNWFPKVHM